MKKKRTRKKQSRKPRSKKTIKICPNCGSKAIGYASMIREAGTTPTAIGLPEKYYCKRCRYSGSVILEAYPSILMGHKFSKKPFKLRKITTLKDKESAMVLQPVFVIVAVLFLISTILFILPRDQGMSVLTTNEQLLTNFTPQSTVLIMPQTIHERTGTVGIERAIGINGVGGFLPNLFFLFLISGLIGIMLYSHWHRMRIFR